MKGFGLIFFIIVTTCFLFTESKNEGEESPLRLPKSLVPIHYLVRIQPFINGNYSFNGHVEITFDVTESTNKLVLHISDIITQNETAKINSIDAPESSLTITSQEYDHEKQFYTATLEDKLEQGKSYIFSVDYEGYLNNDMKGFYRSSYLDDNGKTVMLAATQFQATDARKAFPCLDEPAFKAKFSIEIAREEGYSTISNMPRYDFVPVNGQDGWFWDRFNTSLPMSTYLVAFVVSDFSSLQANTTGTYEFRVWARSNAIASAEYAVNLGAKISRFYEDFFMVPFPLPKQDMIAVPDFSAGGMENWGLITYRESALLYDPLVAKAQDRFRIASIVAHELAHMWFGDLVTPAWWTDLWLNEGFASYVEYIGMNSSEPTMQPLDQFVVLDLHSAFKLDSLESSHPISIPVENPDEINEIFDSISYSKGASIIRMMSSFLTEESFRKGVSKYLTALSYKNAEQDDLWNYLTDQAHVDGTLDTAITVKEVMDTWTLQMGYPVVTVTRKADGTATLTQERYLLAKDIEKSSDSHDYKWWIPITCTTMENPSFDIAKPTEWMTPKEETKTISGMPDQNQWVIFNLAQTGFYRVNYDTSNWEALAQQLKEDHTLISDINKAQIIDDALMLARSGHLEYENALDIVSYLSTEKSYVPITAALNNLVYIKNMLTYTGGYGIMKNFLLSLIIPIYDQIDFSDSLSDPHLEQRKRSQILQWACDLDHEPCLNAASDLFSLWMKNPDNQTIISPNLKSVVYCTAISRGGEKEWRFAWERYTKSSVGTEQKELLEAMSCSRSVWILSEFLNRALSPDQGIKKQMVRYIVPAVARTEIGRYVAWQFVRSRWSDIIDYFGSVSFILDDIIDSVTSSLNTKLQLDELKNFKEANKDNLSSARRSVDQALENVEHNVNWMKNYYDVIIKYLNNKNIENSL